MTSYRKDIQVNNLGKEMLAGTGQVRLVAFVWGICNSLTLSDKRVGGNIYGVHFSIQISDIFFLSVNIHVVTF